MATNPETPGLYPVSLDGRGYLVDLSEGAGGFMSASIPVLRSQSDSGARPGEQSIDPEGLWRRSVESWHHGAGQSRADREASDPYRFRTSLHLSPWERYELSPLNTLGFTAGGGGRSQLVTIADRLYWLQSGSVQFTDDLPDDGEPTFTTVTGLPTNMAGMTSDGHYVYTTHFADDIFRTDASTSVATSYVTVGAEVLDVIRYVKGRLIVFDQGGAVYNPVTAGALPGALYTHPLGSAFVWTDATSGTSNIYMCGTTGFGSSEERGYIYRTAVKADGTGLDVPIIAGRLPDGEGAYAILGYLGLVFIGTSKGVRVAIENADGSLTIGALIETGMCRSFEPQGSHVWFAWENFTDFGPTVYAGLGRIDLSDFDGNSAPPYASDLMTPVTGALEIKAVATFNDRRVFAGMTGTVGAERGLYCETITPVDYGQIVSGLFNYGLTEPKTFHYLSVGAPVGFPSIAAFVTDTDPGEAGQDPTFEWYEGVGRTNLDLADHTHLSLGEADDRATFNDAVFDLGGRRANELQYRLVIGDSISRVTLHARPVVSARTEKLQVPLLLTAMDDIEGTERSRDVREELNYIRSLVRRGSAVPFQDGNESFDVIVEDYRYMRTAGQTAKRGNWNGVCIVTLKRHDTVTPLFRAASSASGASVGSLTVAAPAGSQTSDVLYLAAAWTTGATPTVDGWTLLEENDDTTFRSATWWRTSGADAILDFAGTPSAVAAIAAYSRGDTIDQTDSAHAVVSGDPELTQIAATFTGGLLGAVTAVTGLVDDTDPLLVGPTRVRTRVTLDVGADSLVVELGDAVTTSAITIGGETADTMTHRAFFIGDLRFYAHRLA